MRTGGIVAAVVVGICGSTVVAGEMVGVGGSAIQYATPINSTIGGKQYSMALTGTALRKKLFFSVYAIGSYAQEGVVIHSPEELASLDCAKHLHLVMERDVSGADIAEAFSNSVRANYAAPAFGTQLQTLREYIGAQGVRRGDQIWLTHIPGVGLQVQVVGRVPLVITDVAFARAIWEIYLGHNNLGEPIKQGLVSRI